MCVRHSGPCIDVLLLQVQEQSHTSYALRCSGQASLVFNVFSCAGSDSWEPDPLASGTAYVYTFAAQSPGQQ